MTLRIKKIAASADRVGRRAVTFEDDSVMKLYRQTIEDFGLYAGAELSEERMRSLKDAAGQMSAKMRAMRIVSASSVSRKDLQERLIRKGESREQAEAAVHWMEDMELIDDRKMAMQIVDRCVRSGYGPARARQVLYEKRIPKDLWDEALADYPDQQAYIMKFLEEKLPAGCDERQIKKALDALIRRGHSYGQIQKCLRTLQVEWDEIPEE